MTIVFDEPVNSAMPCRAIAAVSPSPRSPGPRAPQGAGARHRSEHAPLRAGPAHPYLQDAVKIHPGWRDDKDPLAPDDEDEEDADQNRRLDLQSGHGTFIVGLIRRLCPDAEIHVDGVLSGLTTSDDTVVGRGIARAVVEMGQGGPDVVVMTISAYTDDDEPPPLAG